jgi:hypothetical protein
VKKGGCQTEKNRKQKQNKNQMTLAVPQRSNKPPRGWRKMKRKKKKDSGLYLINNELGNDG